MRARSPYTRITASSRAVSEENAPSCGDYFPMLVEGASAPSVAYIKKMGRTHCQQFANQTLRRAVLAEPLAFMRAIANGDTAAALARPWKRAILDLDPSAQVPSNGCSAVLEQRGRYVIVIVTPPAPRESGDPALIAIVGRGDGTTKISTLAYYVLELDRDRSSGAPRFDIMSFITEDERVRCGDGPLPDVRWFADHVFAAYNGKQPSEPTGIPDLPSWYWWLAFDGASALHAFDQARDDAERFAVVRKAPILLLPDIADAAEGHGAAASARRLRELRRYICRDPSMATTWQAIIDRLASSTKGSQPANIMRALTLIADAAGHGALTEAQGYELEAEARSKLAALGVDPQQNHARVEQLYAAARAAQQPRRVARGSTPPPIHAMDPVWEPIFLDETDLPGCTRAQREEVSSASDPTFARHGGLRAAHAAWSGSEWSPMARIIDSRWVFRSASEAHHFLRAMAPAFGEGLPSVAAPQLGDNTLAFGDSGMTSGRRTQVIVVRVGRVIARVQAVEGTQAAQAREILHAALLQPLAAKIVQRVRKALASYWLAVAYPTNAVAALVHSPGYDAARLIAQYPLLAHADLPAAIMHLGDQYTPVARALASFQAQIRAHRWASYRDAMLALVRELLACDVGDPRVNAAHAHEIVCELHSMEPAPIWMQLDAECRARTVSS